MGRKFEYFLGNELCEGCFVGKGEHIQAFALKLVHAFNVSSEGGNARSLSMKEWVQLRDEYRKEQETACWARRLLDYCNKMGSGSLTIVFAFGSLGVVAIQELWEVAFYPNGKPKDKDKPPPSIAVNLQTLQKELHHL